MTAAKTDKKITAKKMVITEEVAIHISDMNKWFGNFHVSRDINLEV